MSSSDRNLDDARSMHKNYLVAPAQTQAAGNIFAILNSQTCRRRGEWLLHRRRGTWGNSDQHLPHQCSFRTELLWSEFY
ncbi:hypothetical protein HKD37_14G041031 [Glycine soja]